MRLQSWLLSHLALFHSNVSSETQQTLWTSLRGHEYWHQRFRAALGPSCLSACWKTPKRCPKSLTTLRPYFGPFSILHFKRPSTSEISTWTFSTSTGGYRTREVHG
ncbi:hypothetical protein BC629DRAFT_165758 [Irpex lacteus]|nr:hypothetical protein BC629DRAFT_165758 [Irpex lacteus]